MSDPSEQEFMKQLGGSAAANVLTMIVFGILYGLKKVCARKSKCKSHLHTCCLDIEVQDQTVRSAAALANMLDGIKEEDPRRTGKAPLGPENV